MLDKIGMLQQVSALGNVSYGFYFGQQSLRLGLSVGYNNYRVNPSNAVAFDLLDPIVNGGNQSAGAISSDIGIAYKLGGLYVFGSVKQLLKTYSNFGYTNLPGYVQRAHYLIGAGYVIPLNNTWEMRPNVLLRSINNVMQADINMDANYKKFIQFGVGFRSQVGVVARAGITVKEKFFFGYAYEAPLANIASYSSGSHEVMLKMTLCRPERTKIVKTKMDTIFKTIERIDTVFLTQTERFVDTIYIDKTIEPSKTPENVGAVSKTILFEFDKSVVKKESYGELESIVNLLEMNPTYKLSLEGHTDAVGTEAYNVGLSKNRVNAVRDFLVMNGIAAERIIIQHHGEGKPVAANDNANGRKSNRRVDVEIILP
jgi:type IX secretion system PorP/SprF family membrane protein